MARKAKPVCVDSVKAAVDALKADAEARVKAAHAEIEVVLKRHGCRLAIRYPDDPVQLAPGLWAQEPRVVAEAVPVSQVEGTQPVA